jgi:DNA primase
LIGRYVELKKAGRNFKGLCPFHAEKTPSFNVNSEKQIFHCFGCSEGGDAIAFMMRHDGLTFPEATHALAKECGIEIAESDSGERGLGDRIFSANDLAQSLYRAALISPEGAAAREYLAERTLDAESIEQSGIGFAPNRWDAVTEALSRAGIDKEVGEASGLLAARRSGKGLYDRLRGRVTFPIRDVRGRILGFGGRALSPDQEPKYLNTPESPVFHKRRALYGFPQALEGIRKSGRAIVCEGYFDRIALDRAGLREGLATCGTALTPDHAVELGRRTKQVVLLFDGDAAGEKALERALEMLLPQGTRVKAATLPTGDDPDSYLSSHGSEALVALVDKAPDALETLIKRALSRGWSTPSEKADVVSRVAPLIARVSHRIERDEYGRRLAVATDSDVASVQAVVRSEGPGRTAARNEALGSIETPRTARRASPEERHHRDLAVLVYRHPWVVTAETRQQLDQVLPEGSWKAIIQVLLEAAGSGLLDASGAVDLFAIENRLDSEARARLREVAVSELLAAPQALPEQVLDHLLRRFSKRKLDARMKELTRRMREPDADTDELLREKQRLSDEVRATRTSM